MRKNLIIACSGDDSLHLSWFSNDRKYDLCVIYYGNNDLVYESYKKKSDFSFKYKGEKYHLIKQIIENEEIIISNYDYIWLPDTDILISVESINQLFTIAEKYKLSICQPSMDGYVSHLITQPIPNNILRYTSFVEILAPLFDLQTFLNLKYTFDCNVTSHALDFVWPKLLNYPENKIAIIDEVVMTHTKPIGGNYERYSVHPHEDFVNTMKKFELDPKNVSLTVYSEIKKI
jgi:hypothetical protein